MRIASIDIGTNTVLMLIADIDERNRLSIVRDEHSIVRLGKSVDGTRMISAEGLERLVDQLQYYLQIAEKEACTTVIATATSALRDAVNRDEVLTAITAATGLGVRILSGDEEADLTFRGAVSGLTHAQKSGEIVVVDIGGGSTEIVKGTRRNVIFKRSLDVGCVRLTERHWQTYPASPEAVSECGMRIAESLDGVELRTGRATWVGVAGTLTTCAAIAQKLSEFEATRVDKYILSRKSVRNILTELSELSLGHLRSHPQIHADRADIIVAGVMILDAVMDKWGLKEMVVSTRGLRYGVALESAVG